MLGWFIYVIAFMLGLLDLSSYKPYDVLDHFLMTNDLNRYNVTPWIQRGILCCS